jgi:hypothetical protein
MSEHDQDAAPEAEASGELLFPDADERAEAAWLIERERNPGTPAPSPELAREYAELEDLLHAMPPGLSDTSWQDDVLQKALVIAAPSRPTRRPAAWIAAAGGLAAIAATAMLWRRPAGAQGLDIAFQKVAVTRSDPKDNVVGDLLIVNAGSRRGGDVRVYRDDTLVAKCPNGGPECTTTPDRYTIKLTLKAPGRYQVYFAPMSGAPESKDEFINAVTEAKTHMDTDEFDVR